MVYSSEETRVTHVIDHGWRRFDGSARIFGNRVEQRALTSRQSNLIAARSSNAAMKRTNRTTLWLSPVVVVPVLASAMAYRGMLSGSPREIARASETLTFNSEDIKSRAPIVAVTIPSVAAAKPLSFRTVKLQGPKSIKELEAQQGPLR